MAKTKTAALTVSLEPAEKAGQGLTLLERAQHLTVSDKPSHTLCLETLKGAKALKREIEDHYAKLKRPLNDARNTVLQMEKDHLAPIDEAIRVMERSATAYVREQQRLEQEETDRRRREAEEDERTRRDEEAAKAEQDALKLEASSNVLSEREQKFVAHVAKSTGTPSPDYVVAGARLAGYKDAKSQASRLMDSPKIQTAIANAQKAAAIRREAEAKQSAPILVDVAPVESQIGNVAGVSQREYYACGEVDLRALVLAVAEDITHGDGTKIQALQANMVFLNAEARSLKSMFSRVHPYAQLSKREGVAG